MYPVTIYLCHMYEFNQETKPAKARGTIQETLTSKSTTHYAPQESERSDTLPGLHTFVFFFDF